MNKKILMFSLLSTVLFSGFWAFNALASGDDIGAREKIQKRERIELTEEQKTEMDKIRLEKEEELKTMTLEEWKSKEIERINNITEEDFAQMKERKMNQKGIMLHKRIMAE